MTKKAERIEAAKGLIILHPEWGSAHINKVLKARYGKGLREIDLAHLKTEVLPSRPKARLGYKSITRLVKEGVVDVAITGTGELARTYHELVSAGFTNAEVIEIFKASKSPGAITPEVFRERAFRVMIQNRKRWWRQQRQRGLTILQIKALINQTHSIKGTSPWDFLREVYDVQLHRKQMGVGDYSVAMARRATKATKKARRFYKPERS